MAAILIVEDDESVSLTLRAILERAGYNVEVTATPAGAINKLATKRFEVVVLDHQLGGEDGFEILRRLPQIAPRTVALVLTGDGSLDALRIAKDEGAFEFLLKPADPPDVLDAISRARARRPGQDEANQPHARQPAEYRTLHPASFSFANLITYTQIASGVVMPGVPR